MRRAVRMLVVAASLAAAEWAHAGHDPFLKQQQGRLSHEMNVRSLAAEGDVRAASVRATNVRSAGPVTAVIELERGADRNAVSAEVSAAGGRVLVAVDH